MTETTLPSVEDLSQRIAARGRVALVERLRTAYRDAASAHADIISLEHERLEALVQNAADHADGLQWRRALAGLAAEELGVSVAEALSHPAVARAQAIVGAPSYEQSLAELITRPIPPPLPSADPDYEDPDAPPRQIDGQMQMEAAAAAEDSLVTDESLSEELEATVADDTVVELLPAPDPSLELSTESYELPVEELPEPVAQEAAAPVEELPEPVAQEAAAPVEELPEPVAQEDTAPVAQEASAPVEGAYAPAAAELPVDEGDVGELRVRAIHLGGVANLPTGGDGVDLRMSEQGLDIMRDNDEILGRLPWGEIEALEVPSQRRRRRQNNVAARLVVRTRQGDASFEIPGFSSEELRDRVELRLDRYRQL